MMTASSDISGCITAALSARRTPISNLRGLITAPSANPCDLIAAVFRLQKHWPRQAGHKTHLILGSHGRPKFPFPPQSIL
jgi:hypothetical protein